jgi:cell division protein FtsB
MAFTAAEEARILAIERVLADMLVTITKLAAKQQLNQLQYMKQAEYDALEQRVTALESMVTLLQNRI